MGVGPRGAHARRTKSDLREDLPRPGTHRALGRQTQVGQGLLCEGLELEAFCWKRTLTVTLILIRIDRNRIRIRIRVTVRVTVTDIA